MKYLVIIGTVLFVAVYGFKISLPTSHGTLTFKSGYSIDEERF